MFGLSILMPSSGELDQRPWRRRATMIWRWEPWLRSELLDAPKKTKSNNYTWMIRDLAKTYGHINVRETYFMPHKYTSQKIFGFCRTSQKIFGFCRRNLDQSTKTCRSSWWRSFDAANPGQSLGAMVFEKGHETSTIFVTALAQVRDSFQGEFSLIHQCQRPSVESTMALEPVKC